MKRFVLSAAGLIAAVSIGTAMANNFVLTMDNQKGAADTFSVMKIGKYCTTNPAVVIASGNPGYTPAKQKATIPMPLGGLRAICGNSCTIELFESTDQKCDGLSLGTVQMDSTAIGNSGKLFSNKKTGSSFEISGILPNNQGVTITTNK